MHFCISEKINKAENNIREKQMLKTIIKSKSRRFFFVGKKFYWKKKLQREIYKGFYEIKKRIL